jgi:hypothetical protein
MSSAGADEHNAQCDHDRLLELKARFEEYRTSMDGRLEKLNELRGQVETDRLLYLRADVFDVRHQEILKSSQEMAARLDNYMRADVFAVRLAEVLKRAEELAARVLSLEKWQSHLLGISGTLIAVALVIGALVGRFKW